MPVSQDSSILQQCIRLSHSYAVCPHLGATRKLNAETQEVVDPPFGPIIRKKPYYLFLSEVVVPSAARGNEHSRGADVLVWFLRPACHRATKESIYSELLHCNMKLQVVFY